MMAQPDFGAGVDAMCFVEDGGEPPQPFGVLAPSSALPADHPGAGGARYYTIQRVNGGAHGKGNEGSGHKHTLEESDAIKKNSVRRKILKEEKEKKRNDVSTHSLIRYLVQLGQFDLLCPYYHFKFGTKLVIIGIKTDDGISSSRLNDLHSRLCSL